MDFTNNTISLEGRTNKTAILLVEFWWWLHRKADYMRATRTRQEERLPEGVGGKSC